MVEVGFVTLGALLAAAGIAIAARSTTPIRRLSSAVVIASGAVVGLVPASSATDRSYGVSAALVLAVVVIAESVAGLALVVMARASGAAELVGGSDAIGSGGASRPPASARRRDGSLGEGLDRDELRDRGGKR